MFRKIAVPVVWAGMLLGAVPGGVQLCRAQAAAPERAGEEDYRVVPMGEDAAEKRAAGADDWDEIIKANNYDKLTGNDKQVKKAELAEEFDPDSLDRERQRDWFGAAEDCAGKGGCRTIKSC